MNAADMMTSPVVTIGPEAIVRDAAWAMLTNRISAVPVLDGQGRMVGILSEGDLLRRAETGTQRRRSWWTMFGVGSEELAAEFVKSHGRKVADVMSRDVITATGDTPAPEIARLMETHGIKRVPIVADGKLVGIVSRADFLTALTGVQQAAKARKSRRRGAARRDHRPPRPHAVDPAVHRQRRGARRHRRADRARRLGCAAPRGADRRRDDAGRARGAGQHEGATVRGWPLNEDLGRRRGLGPIRAIAAPEHDPEKACPGLDPGWIPVFGKDHARHGTDMGTVGAHEGGRRP